MRYWSDSEQTTEALGRELARDLRAGDTVWLLGGLGAGKTAFVRGLARGLGCAGGTSAAGPVTSPTYTLVHEYGGGRVPLFHFDVYRLAGARGTVAADSLADIGWEDYAARGGICAVEWAQIIEPLPEDGVRVTIRAEAEDGRWITIDR
ncbi:MAG: tRNA (adenosine(37)-N6)-threonylcarbamoyltransferase complex ATPase subunit type 1 TsaE [Oscillospiraceae bacterium]|nr:tRNA (adenosine(37)-N6)-threonylcarbamoyltransferase complex ATPase subunit type 1 TsaE [Oscillospiraceae bacterium]